MKDTTIPGPAWIPAFLARLQETRSVTEAFTAAGVTPGAVYFQRKRNQKFAEAWMAALSGKLDEVPQVSAAAGPAAAQNAGWRGSFLEKLAETSNITASAFAANVPVSTVYRLRAKNPDFAGKWRAALYEGYVNLEMEVLGYLRTPDPGYKMDVANALRLLSAHKEAVAQEGAVRANVSTAEVRASIARKVELIRKQALAEKAEQAQSGDE